MSRTCFFCHKPLPIERRASAFCSLRCQELEERMQAVSASPRNAAALTPDPDRIPSASLALHPKGVSR